MRTITSFQKLSQRQFYSFVSTVFLFLFFLFNCSSIQGQTSSERVDSIAFNNSETYENPKDLAAKLVESLDSDLEKARAFYLWIAQNIEYDCKKFHKRIKPNIQAHTQKDYDQKLKEWHEKQIQNTIKNKKGICEDYSRLFKALCDESGIESKLIIGNARDQQHPHRKLYKNPHSWNAVKIGNKWFLLDATWGAGFNDVRIKKFTRKVSTRYFLTPPKFFIQNHLPDDDEWQLLENPISKKEFRLQPLINYGNDEYKIINYSSSSMPVKNEKDKQEIWLEFENAPKEFSIVTKAGKRIPFSKTEKEGKIVFSFSSSIKQNITIFGGESQLGIMDWIAKYRL